MLNAVSTSCTLPIPEILYQRMRVDVQIEASTKSVQDGDAAAFSLDTSSALRLGGGVCDNAIGGFQQVRVELGS